VTDVDSPTEADWGTAVKTGKFANVPMRPVIYGSGQWGTPQVAVIDQPVSGRFIYLRPVSAWGAWPGGSEVWAYGTPIPTGPTISAFTAADQTTGSELFTNSATVDVSITAEPVAPETPVAGLLVTETPDVPDVNDPNWAASISEYTITGGEGSVTLYAWAKDAADVISDPVSATILFSTAAPVVSNIAVTDNGDGTATATWTTDINAEGSLNYGPVIMSGATPNSVPENAVGTNHSVTFATETGKNYRIILVNNEIACVLLAQAMADRWRRERRLPCEHPRPDLHQEQAQPARRHRRQLESRRERRYQDQHPRPDLREEQAQHAMPTVAVA